MPAVRRLRATVAARRVAAAVGVVAVFAALTSGGAASPPSEQAAELRAENVALAAKSRSALLELYALEQEQAAAQARIASIRGELDEL